MENDNQYLISPSTLGKWISECPDLWQMEFLNPSKFAWYIKEKGLNSCSQDHIKLLWRLGLLRADIVFSSRKLMLKGLNLEKRDSTGNYIYSDHRPILRRKSGWASIAAKVKPIAKHIELLFHPFRYYPLYHIRRVLRLNINPLQFLLSVENYPKALQMVSKFLIEWTSKPDATYRLEWWTNVAELAIASEPCTYELIFNSIKYSVPYVELENQKRRIHDHWVKISPLYEAVGRDRIETIRDQLCSDAELIDPNKDLHTLIRLMNGPKRLKLKGKIGGSIHLLTMAEMLRRVSEKIFDIHLREEDELGFGWTPPDVKRKIYGANRIIGSGSSVANEFMRQFGLDYGVRVRCYVEGDTEYYALNHVFERYNSIELLNLRGIIAQKGGKGVSFRENLRIDIKSHIFSLILIDGDNNDYYRALKKAAETDQICGFFMISIPDFEFYNFTASELGHIAYRIQMGTKGDEIENHSLKRSILNAVKNSRSNKEFFNCLKSVLPESNDINKGGLWGTELMKYALKYSTMEKNGEAVKRPVIDFCKTAFQGFTSNFHYSRKNYCVDPQTGKLIKRSQ